MKKIIIFLVFLLLVGSVSAQVLYDKENRAQLIEENLENIDLGNAPKMLKFVLGKPKINIEVNGNVYGFKITGNKIGEFAEGGLEKPHYIIKISESDLEDIIASDDIASAVGEKYMNGEITVEPQRIGAKIKFWIAKKFIK